VLQGVGRKKLSWCMQRTIRGFRRSRSVMTQRTFSISGIRLLLRRKLGVIMINIQVSLNCPICIILGGEHDMDTDHHILEDNGGLELQGGIVRVWCNDVGFSRVHFFFTNPSTPRRWFRSHRKTHSHASRYGYGKPKWQRGWFDRRLMPRG